MVDMVPFRFLKELKRLKPFQRYGKYSPTIQTASLPPKQAVMTALFLLGHAGGYHLPEWEEFLQLYVSTVLKHGSYEEKFSPCFTRDGEPRDGLLWRMSEWYEDSMAHAFLYTILVLAYEDLDQSAFVSYDARMDWKHKADITILRSMQGALTGVRVNIQGQDSRGMDRSKTEARRICQEVYAKRNTIVSSQRSNRTYHTLPSLRIARGDGVPIVVNGFRLFSLDVIEDLMRNVDLVLGQTRRDPMPIEEMLKYRVAQAMPIQMGSGELSNDLLKHGSKRRSDSND